MNVTLAEYSTNDVIDPGKNLHDFGKAAGYQYFIPVYGIAEARNALTRNEMEKLVNISNSSVVPGMIDYTLLRMEQ